MLEKFEIDKLYRLKKYDELLQMDGVEESYGKELCSYVGDYIYLKAMDDIKNRVYRPKYSDYIEIIDASGDVVTIEPWMCEVCNDDEESISDGEIVIKIKYFDENMPKIEKIEKGDWIDLRSGEQVTLRKGDFALIPLGVAMELPKGYEAHVVPRSSTFKNYHIIQTNGMGVIDEDYNGNDDQWFMPVIATQLTTIEKYDRICQFRIVEKMPQVRLEHVDQLNNENRGGHGSTGTK